LNKVLQAQVNHWPKTPLAAALDIALLTRPLHQDLVSRLTCSAVGLPSPVGPVVQGLSFSCLVLSFLFFCCAANDGQLACCVQKWNALEEVLVSNSFMEVFVLICTTSQTALHPLRREQNG